ncbi:MAG: hypothetical protein DSY37_02240 [Hyperthermus sp.]|nr:MAG: hypothetical protein DSY37_02240 [Hyperthermus sp.]
MSFVEYRETIDYVWVLARAFDRWAEAVAEAGRRPNKAAAVEAVCFAAHALAALAAPFSGNGFNLRRCVELARDGRPLAALEEASSFVAMLARELDRRGLLVRRTELLMGSYGGEVGGADTGEADL